MRGHFSKERERIILLGCCLDCFYLESLFGYGTSQSLKQFFSVSFFTADRVHGPSKAILEGLSDYTAVSESMNEGSLREAYCLLEAFHWSKLLVNNFF